MAWTYSGDPSSGSRDQVRFLIHDTDTSDQLLQDEEIDWVLTERPNVYLAGETCCIQIATGFSRFADQSTQDLSDSYSQRAKMYSERAMELRELAWKSTPVIPYAGGTSVSDKELQRDNDNIVQPRFRRDQFDLDRDVEYS